MKSPRKCPPHHSCRLKPGTRLRVVDGFTASGVEFTRGEELIFKGETFDPYFGWDEWVFSAVIRSGVEANPLEKMIRGYGEFFYPAAWLRCLEAVEPKRPNKSPEPTTTAVTPPAIESKSK